MLSRIHGGDRVTATQPVNAIARRLVAPLVNADVLCIVEGSLAASIRVTAFENDGVDLRQLAQLTEQLKRQ